MNVILIYQRYGIPTNLQQHMLRVAGVGQAIVDDFAGRVDGGMLVKTLLLHDMGNLIKFKFDDVTMLAAFDQQRIAELKEKKAELIARYGTDCDEATLQIIAEITEDRRIVNLCGNSHGEDAHRFVRTDEWEKKISYYCDMRVGPFGVLTVDQRFDDLEKRYADRDQQKLLTLRRYRSECLLIQEQIQCNCRLDLDEINDKMVNDAIEPLKKWEI